MAITHHHCTRPTVAVYRHNCHLGFWEERVNRASGSFIHPTVASGELAQEGFYAQTGFVSSARARLCWTSTRFLGINVPLHSQFDVREDLLASEMQ